jgi:high affinity Mn2+ porin
MRAKADWKCHLGTGAVIALALVDPANAKEFVKSEPRKALAPVPYLNWSGFYVGGHLGYGRGHANDSFADPVTAGSNKALGSLFGGVQLGYNHVLNSGVLLGVESDLSFPNFLGADDVVRFRITPQGNLSQKIDYVGRFRGRVGYAFDNWLVYGTGGLAWSQARFIETSDLTGDEDKAHRVRGGWVVGAGAEVAIAPDWSARLEYLYDNFGKAAATMPSGVRSETTFDTHTLRLGLNWHLGRTGADALPFESRGQPLIDSADWNVHGQYTLIGQGYPSFNSPYEGPKSLAGSKQAQNTQSATAYVGLRLWEGAEFYINPELMQGFGLSDVHGLAGFTNGEAQKSNFPAPRLNVARIFLRQTFGLGGEQETINDGPNQLAGKQDISRITVTAGKFAVTDAFDGNVYANDPRTTFLNWNIYGGGSYD